MEYVCAGKEPKGCGSRDQIRRPARYQTPAAHKATKVGERPTVRYRVDLSDSLFCVLPLLQSRGHSNREAAAPQSQEHKTALLGVFLHTVRIARKCDRPQCNRVMVRAKENAATDRGGRLDTHPSTHPSDRNHGCGQDKARHRGCWEVGRWGVCDGEM